MLSFLKKWIPNSLLYKYSNLKNRNKSAEEIFTEIYQKNYWGVAENENHYFSGSGTADVNVTKYLETLSGFIKENNIQHIFEIGCGDFSIMNSLMQSQPELNYVGADIVKELIHHLNQSFANNKTNFIHLDGIQSVELPSADLCIIRQVLQHLNNRQIAEIIEKTKKYRFVMITEHLPLYPKVKNGDKPTSGYIRMQNKEVSGVFLEEAPFSLDAKTMLSYRKDDLDYSGKIIPAEMRTSLLENNR